MCRPRLATSICLPALLRLVRAQGREGTLMVGEKPFHLCCGRIAALALRNVPVTSQVTKASPAAPYLANSSGNRPDRVVAGAAYASKAAPSVECGNIPVAAQYALDPA